MRPRVTVTLDPAVHEQLARVARRKNLTPGAFLAQAGEAALHRVLVDEAVERYFTDPGGVTLSELAAESGLAAEEIALAMDERNREIAAATGESVEAVVRARGQKRAEGTDAAFLRWAASMTGRTGDQTWLRQAEDVVANQRGERGLAHAAKLSARSGEAPLEE